MHKFFEVYHEKCLDNIDDVSLALLQMRSTPIGAGLPSPATLLFNRPIKGLLPQITRELFNINGDDKHFEASNTSR